jgi:hypothetical protein
MNVILDIKFLLSCILAQKKSLSKSGLAQGRVMYSRGTTLIAVLKAAAHRD